MKSFKDWSLRYKLVLLAGLPSVALLFAFGLLYLSLSIQSAARAYVGGESLWAKGQKDAVYDLRKYVGDRSEDDYIAYQQAIAVPLGDMQARVEMDKRTPDYSVVTQGFAQGGNNNADIPGMISLYRYFHGVGYFARPIAVWRQADVQIALLQTEAAALHAEVVGRNDRAVESADLSNLDRVNAQLDTLEREFSADMGEASRWVSSTLLAISLALFLLIALITSGLVYAIIRRALRDLGSLNEVMTAAEAGDYKLRVKPYSNDELGRLGEVVNKLLATVLSSRQTLEENLKRSNDDRQQLEDTKKAVLNILEDLSDEKVAAEEARLRDEALLRSIGEGLIVTDERGNVSYVNNMASEILGYEVGEMVGQWFPRLIQALDTSAKPIADLERPITQALTTGQPVAAQELYRRKDGSTVQVFLTVSPVVVDDVPIGAIEVFRDITKEAELERAKDEFVSLASHQLRTPATGVKAFASMLMDGYAGKLTEKQAEFARKIFESNERQLRIVDDMLNVARVDAGRMVLQPAMTDMNQLVQAVIEEQTPTIQERQQTIHAHLPSSKLEQVIDPERFRMVMDNLVNNASKYTPEGGQIDVWLKPEDKTIAVEVSDTGVGIAKRDIPKLFTKFTRLDNPLSTKVGGSGLGLYLVGSIVKLHKGKIQVESEPGKGTTFRVILPKVAKLPKQGAIVEKEERVKT